MAPFDSAEQARTQDISLVPFDAAEQPLSSNGQEQDLFFDGEASMGIGGLIEALAQGSLDGLVS
jgi:hypothetical protein